MQAHFVRSLQSGNSQSVKNKASLLSSVLTSLKTGYYTIGLKTAWWQIFTSKRHMSSLGVRDWLLQISPLVTETPRWWCGGFFLVVGGFYSRVLALGSLSPPPPCQSCSDGEEAGQRLAFRKDLETQEEPHVLYLMVRQSVNAGSHF